MRKPLVALSLLATVTVQAASITSSPQVTTRGAAIGSIVGYGTQNSARGMNSLVIGGSNNVLNCIEGAILGGSGNWLIDSAVGGRASVIAGGEDCIITNNSGHGFIAGGWSNVLDGGRYGFIAGWLNKATASNSMVLGYRCTNHQWSGTVAGGYNNVISNGVDVSVGSSSSFIGGGSGNQIWGHGNYVAIIGGVNNKITNNQGNFVDGGTIAGGFNNVIGASYSFLGSGLDCVIDGVWGADVTSVCLIGTGQENRIRGAAVASILNGFQNQIRERANYATILNGQGNIISADAEGATIVGGNSLTVSQGNTVYNGFRTAFPASSLQTIAAAGAVLANATKVRVAGSGGAITLNATTSIADGTDGQILYIYGTSDVNTVAVPDNSNVQTAGGVTRTLGNRDILVLMFDATNSDWAEVSFSNN